MNPEQGPDLDERDLEEIAALLDGRLEGEARQRAVERLGQNEQAYQIYVESARFLDWQDEQGATAPADAGAPPAPRSPGRWRWLPAAAVAALALVGLGGIIGWSAAPSPPGLHATVEAAIEAGPIALEVVERAEMTNAIGYAGVASVEGLYEALEISVEQRYMTAGFDIDPALLADRGSRFAEQLAGGRKRGELNAILSKNLQASLLGLDRFDLSFYFFALGSPELALQQFEESKLSEGNAGLVVANNMRLIQLAQAHDVLGLCSSTLAASYLPPMTWDLRRPFRVTRSLSEQWQECEPNFDPLLDDVLFDFEELVARDPSYEAAQVNYMAALLVGHRGHELTYRLEQLPGGLRESPVGKIFAALAPLALRYDVCGAEEEGPQPCETALARLDELRARPSLARALAASVSYNRATILRKLSRLDESDLEFRRFLTYSVGGFYSGKARNQLSLEPQPRRPPNLPDLRAEIVAALDSINPNNLAVEREQQVSIGSTAWRLLRSELEAEISLVVASETQTVLAVRRLESTLSLAGKNSTQATDLAEPTDLDMVPPEVDLTGFQRLPTFFQGSSDIEFEVWAAEGIAYRVQRHADGRRTVQAQVLVRPGFLQQAEEELVSQEGLAANEESAGLENLLSLLAAIQPAS